MGDIQGIVVQGSRMEGIMGDEEGEIRMAPQL